MSSDSDTNGSTNEGGVFTDGEAVELYRERIDDPELFAQERKAVDRYITDTDASVLDVGCGVGRISHLLHERGFHVTGIDVSKPLVEEGRSLFPEIDFHIADIRDLPFASESFDHVVFSWFGLDYVLPKAERIEALGEIWRVLKPSGIGVFSSHNHWHSFVPIPVDNPPKALRDVVDLYLREKNHERIGSRYKIESVPLGEVEIYLSDPIHQWLQLRKCGFTLLDVVGERDGLLRFLERQPHYIVKK
jgi:ubiquinone/menaquinone biosynthesis C-methylase UbiE